MQDLSLLKYETIFHWIAVLLYISSSILFMYGLIFKKEKSLNSGWIVSLSGLIPHSIALGIRWFVQGHGPYMIKYEVLSSNAWICIVMFLVISRKIPRLKAAGGIVVAVSFIAMTAGLFTNPDIKMLPPSLRSIWLLIHVLFNKLAAASLLIAFSASVLYLLKEKKGEAQLFSLSTHMLDLYNYRFAGIGFFFWTITIIAGAIWANQSWGRYWGWDPVETWSLVTWLLLGFYLHMRVFYRWSGRKAAWAMILCFSVSVLTIFIIPMVVESLHTQYFQ